MKYRICISALLLWAGMQLSASNNQEEVVIKIIETSDVHGNFFPYNFIERKEWSGSLARVHSFVKEQREKYGDNCLLMDNGDILQGQPTAYYYNFMDTVSTHVAADMMNYMGYVVGNMGNHDVETGHAVYDRWIKQCDFPVLGANIIDNATGKPYLKPYEVLERDGVRIAVLGMITPAIPSWLPEKLWSGLHFEEMEPCARKWVKIIKEKENPDVIVGLFHAGKSGNVLGQVVEDASMDVAKRVPGFDVVLMGHDHTRECVKVQNVAGDSVLVIDPANNANVVSDVTLTVTKKDGKVVEKSVEGRLADMNKYPVSREFMDKFAVGQTGNKSSKFVEAAKGTNLFFAVYESNILDKKTNTIIKKRNYATIPLNVAIERQKQGLPVAPEDENGNDPIFVLSPNDLVYLPTDDELANGIIAQPLDRGRIYKMVSSSGEQCFFIKHIVANVLVDKFEFSPLNKMERALTGEMIKMICMPIKVDRLGNVLESSSSHKK